MASRAITWVKDDPLGAEFADVVIAPGLGGAKRLTAKGIAIGSKPVGYRLDYKLETKSEFITSGLLVVARGEGWLRRLDLRRLKSGRWTARTKAEGVLDLPPVGGDMARLDGVLDCDLAWSPLTNSMPVLRHGLLDGGGPFDFVMAWVSVPDLSVHASRQRYTFVRKVPNGSVIRYESRDSSFAAEVTFDSDGLVVDYPGVGRRPEG
jgi:hypothetical protein